MDQGKSGQVELGTPGWADGDRAFARSSQELIDQINHELGGAPQHPNANIEPVLGFAQSDEFGEPCPARQWCPAIAFEDARNAQADFERAVDRAYVHSQLGVPFVPPIKLGPGGDYVVHQTPSVWVRCWLGNTAFYAAIVLLIAVYGLTLVMLGGGGN